MSNYSGTPSRKGSGRGGDTSSLMAASSRISGSGGGFGGIAGDSSYLAIIAGPGGVGTPQAALINGRSSSSLESEEQAPSIANSDLLEEEGEDDAHTEDGNKTHSR